MCHDVPTVDVVDTLIETVCRTWYMQHIVSWNVCHVWLRPPMLLLQTYVTASGLSALGITTTFSMAQVAMPMSSLCPVGM